MKAYWQQLERKDKQLFVALALTLLLAAGYWLVWQPLQTELANTQRKITAQTQTLEEVKVLGQKISELQDSTNTGSASQDLNQLINTTAQSNNIAISRIQAKSDSVQLWIDDVNFNQFVTWLEELSKQYEVDIQNVDISATDSPGMIKVSRLQLGR